MNTTKPGIYRVASIPGDHIGNEVIPEAIKALETVAQCVGVSFEFDFFPWGANYYSKNGFVMAPDGLEVLSDYDAILLGAVGDPAKVADHIAIRDLVLKIRKEFDLYVNLRPIRSLPGVAIPIIGVDPFDFVFVRENTEGEYSDIGGWLYKGSENEIALQTSVFTRRSTERIIRHAFGLARDRQRQGKVTSVTKSNVLNYSMTFWDRIFQEVATEYPDISTETFHVDAMAMYLIQRPSTFDVIVTSNLFGDILSDEASAVQGGIGLTPSANINPERLYPSMFEPIHGSAPDIAGLGKANPVAAILSGHLMLQHLGEIRMAELILQAVERVLSEGAIRTSDLGGDSTTEEVGNAIAERIEMLWESAEGSDAS